MCGAEVALLVDALRWTRLDEDDFSPTLSLRSHVEVLKGIEWPCSLERVDGGDHGHSYPRWKLDPGRSAQPWSLSFQSVSMCFSKCVSNQSIPRE